MFAKDAWCTRNTKENIFNSCFIWENEKTDFEKEYTIKIDFYTTHVLMKIKWSIELKLFKEVLNWMNTLSFKFYFEIETKYLIDRTDQLLACIKKWMNKFI